MSDQPQRPDRWTRRIPLIVALLLGAYILSGTRPVKQPTPFDLDTFASLPVSHQGRVKPLDTVARSTMLMIYGKQDGTVRRNDPAHREPLPAMKLLMDITCRPDVADRYRIFTIHDPDVLGMMGFAADQKRFAFRELAPHFNDIAAQSEEARRKEPAARTRYQKAVLDLAQHLSAYHRLKNAFGPESLVSFASEVEDYAKVVNLIGDTNESPALKDTLDPLHRRYARLAQMTDVLTIPPADGDTTWHTTGAAMLEAMNKRSLDPAVRFYAAAREAYAKGDADTFNALVFDYAHTPRMQAWRRPTWESLFNAARPFTRAMAVYVIAFVLACLSWLRWSATLSRTAWAVVGVGALVHTAGLVARMAIEGRPPVTNLYSSAVFVGWGAVIVGILLERLWRNGVGTAVASAIGFGTLIIAHHLSLTGDTMEAMRAVLDSNFWLATHVVVITLGYSATFLAGFLAIVYVVRGVLTRSLDAAAGDAIHRMVYGILCFAILFSFVGTVLGGIWADQSWGRFWGWDPKENGALMIVLWNAVVLHARWGGMVRARGTMLMAIFGNIITSFSWFGVNMLGVGLHSYGFMDEAFFWLSAFIISQVALIALGALPPQWWRSVRPFTPARRATA